MGNRERGTGTTKTAGTGNRERGIENGNGLRRNGCICPRLLGQIGFVAPRPIRDYRDLIVWQQAIELAQACDKVADALPRKAWRTAQQLRDAAESVHLNIAEGNGRPTITDYLRFLATADASLNEVQSNLYAVSRRFPRVDDTALALRLTVRVSKPLAGLIRSLRRKREEE